MNPREKLEADIRQWLDSRLIGNEVFETVISWLDRQEAITKWKYIDTTDELKVEIDELMRKSKEFKQTIAELNGAVCERDGRISAYERRNAELNDALKAICNHYGVGTKWAAEDAVKNVFETIDSTYMKLPVDADGMPIRIGDTMERVCAEMPGTFIVGLIGADGHCMDDETNFFLASECRHVKPDTVESLLMEFALATDYAGDWNNPDDVDERRRQVDALAAEYAERIRKAVEE